MMRLIRSTFAVTSNIEMGFVDADVASVTNPPLPPLTFADPSLLVLVKNQLGIDAGNPIFGDAEMVSGDMVLLAFPILHFPTLNECPLLSNPLLGRQRLLWKEGRHSQEIDILNLNLPIIVDDEFFVNYGTSPGMPKLGSCRAENGVPLELRTKPDFRFSGPKMSGKHFSHRNLAMEKNLDRLPTSMRIGHSLVDVPGQVDPSTKQAVPVTTFGGQTPLGDALNVGNAGAMPNHPHWSQGQRLNTGVSPNPQKLVTRRYAGYQRGGDRDLCKDLFWSGKDLLDLGLGSSLVFQHLEFQLPLLLLFDLVRE